MARGFVYLSAVVDVASRLVLAHKMAITLEACHAKEIIEQAFARNGAHVIVNTDQGSQFTAEEFTQAVLDRGCQLSMDGRGAWRDNVFIERLWHNVKYECAYLKTYDGVSAARSGIGRYMHWSTPTRRIRGSMAPRPNRPIWTWCQNWRRPHSMESVVRPELSTAAAGPSQAPTAAVDNSAPRSTNPEPTYKSGKTVQRTGTASMTNSRKSRTATSSPSRAPCHPMTLAISATPSSRTRTCNYGVAWVKERICAFNLTLRRSSSNGLNPNRSIHEKPNDVSRGPTNNLRIMRRSVVVELRPL
jgi:hypothetical protein